MEEEQKREEIPQIQEDPATCTIQVRCFNKSDKRYHLYRTHTFRADSTTRKMYDVISTFDREIMFFPDPDDEETFFRDSVSKMTYQINEQTMPEGKNYAFKAILL